MSNEDDRGRDVSAAPHDEFNATVQRSGKGSKLVLGLGLVAVVAGLGWWLWPSSAGGPAAFGAMVEQIRTARTAQFRTTVTQESIPEMSYTTLISDNLIRMEWPNGVVGLTDQDAGRQLTLIPDSRRALLTQWRRRPEVPEAGASGRSDTLATRYFNLAKSMQANEGVTYQGRRKVDGRKVHEYHASYPEAEMTILADAETNAPYRFSIHLPDKSGTMVMSDFVFDADLDPALLSFTPPEGYQLIEVPQGGSIMDALKGAPARETDAFGAMVKQLRAARTAQFRMTFQQESKPEMSCEMLVSGSITRMEWPGHPIGVMDQDSGRRLILMPDRKRAVLLPGRPGPAAPKPEPSQAYATRCFNLIKTMQVGEQVAYQGQREVDGRMVQEYAASHPEAPMTILVDAETNAPYRFSVHMPDQAGTLVMSDFVFDEDLDPALFSFTPPEDYQVMEVPQRGALSQTTKPAPADASQTRPE